MDKENFEISLIFPFQVLKYGATLGRSVDLARFDGYGELICELDQMFEFKGTLIDGSSGYYVTYIDEEWDMMLIGDYPWPLSTKTLTCFNCFSLCNLLVFVLPSLQRTKNLYFYRCREFRTMVRKMFVCPKEHIDKLDVGSSNPASS